MTTNTLTPKQKQTLLAAIPKIEQAGGPKWYGWCDLESQTFYGTVVHCPAAAAAAVIAWAAHLHKWAYSQGFGGRLCLVSCGTATVLYEALALISAVAEGLGEG